MSQYDRLLLASAQRYGVDPTIARQVIGTESNWDPNAVSPKGAMGLGQLMPGTAQEMGVTDPYDPAQNIDGSMKYLSQQIKKYGVHGGLAAYNAGPGRYERAGGDISKLPRETQQYVSKVTGMAGNTSPQISNVPSALPNARAAAAYDPNDPASVYQFLMQNQVDVPPQQLSPEQRQMMLQSRQQRAGMLPLAIGASLSGDKRISALGSQLYKDASAAQGPQAVGDDGWLTEGGDLVENPFRASNREEKRRDTALTLAVKAAEARQLKQMGLDATRANQNITGENSAADDYMKAIKNDWTIISAGQNLATTPKTAAGDVAYIFQYMKMLDPTSVVREGEFANAQNTTGIPDRVLNLYNRALTGERLNDKQRAEMQDTANQLSDTAYRRMEGQQSFYKDLAGRRGYNYENIVPKHHSRPQKPASDAPGAGGAPAAAGGQVTKQIGDKTYVKINGQWYEQ